MSEQPINIVAQLQQIFDDIYKNGKAGKNNLACLFYPIIKQIADKKDVNEGWVTREALQNYIMETYGLPSNIFGRSGNGGALAIDNVWSGRFTSGVYKDLLNQLIEFKTQSGGVGQTREGFKLKDKHANDIRGFLSKYELPKDSILSCINERILAMSKNNSMDVATSENKKTNETLNQPLNLILYGPPGTGKTYETAELAVQICTDNFPEKRDDENYEDYRKRLMKEYAELSKKVNDDWRITFVTFHQSYGYEEFVEGLRPVIADADSTDVPAEDPQAKNTTPANTNDNTKGQVQYEISSGAFKTICEKAKGQRDKNFVIIIDEINRGNISKILGELITLVEEDKREGKDRKGKDNVNALSVTLPYSKKPFSVPNNVYIIGTMNTADRSLAQVDIALRRRFNFVEMIPKPEVLNGLIISGIAVSKMLTTINKRIEALYDRDHTIGHAYFTKLIGKGDGKGDGKGFEELQEIFKNKIIPLLQEYFFDDWEKIRLILGDNQKDEKFQFIKEHKVVWNELFGNGYTSDYNDGNDGNKTKRYKINDDNVFNDPQAYIQIYPPLTSQ